jgi:hypothetical protein
MIFFPRPYILQNPNVPKPMHGRNPRSILGKEWWDEKRQAAYRRYDYCCWACGIHKRQAAYHHWLEGHEIYTIDYPRGRMELQEIVALCHSCHNFIHSGRMVMRLEAGELEPQKYVEIVNHGWSVLKAAGLRPWPFVLPQISYARSWLELTHDIDTGWKDDLLTDEMLRWAEKEIDKSPVAAPWSEWRMIIEGEEYKPVHENFEAWRAYYNGQN